MTIASDLPPTELPPRGCGEIKINGRASVCPSVCLSPIITVRMQISQPDNRATHVMYVELPEPNEIGSRLEATRSN